MRFPSSKVRKKNEITMEINKKNEEKNITHSSLLIVST